MSSARDVVSEAAGGGPFASLRVLADQAFSRAAGAPLVPGNRVRLLQDGRENYPAWLEAIASARHSIHFECYIIHGDEVGRQFADALAAKAREGVRVRLIYDWMGALGAFSFRLWRPLRRAGVSVRCFNPPHLDSPFGWTSRDHRKMLAVDGRIAFITGLCVGRAWTSDPERRREAWRDTGVEIAGPAVADIEHAFATMWDSLGDSLPVDEVLRNWEAIPSAGEAMLRIVASMPNTGSIYRLDQMVAALARRSIWLTDAYFVANTSYVEALKAAAIDGVDVRLLVPRSSDIPGMRSISRAGFRGLLEAGVRIFEWTGPMLHAKTAVADGRWARVGSTNLNLASWMGNWELDVIAEDERFAGQMEAMYLHDLNHSAEIVLTSGRRAGTPTKMKEAPVERPARINVSRRKSSRGTAAGMLRIGHVVGAAVTNRRALGPAESKIMVGAACFLLLLAVCAYLWPRSVAVPVTVLGVWTAVSLLIRAIRLRS